MNSCSKCRGKFGLIRHNWWGHQFCSKNCKAAYLEMLEKERVRLRRWFAFLHGHPETG